MQQLPSAAAVNRLVGLLKTIKTARNTYSGIIEDMRLAKFDSMAQAKLKSCAVMVESVKRDSDRAIAFMNASGEIDTINRAG
jgi:hypothetical protein